MKLKVTKKTRVFNQFQSYDKIVEMGGAGGLKLASIFPP